MNVYATQLIIYPQLSRSFALFIENINIKLHQVEGCQIIFYIQNGHEWFFIYLLHQVSKLLARKIIWLSIFLFQNYKNKSNVPPCLLRRSGCLVNTMALDPRRSVGANIGA